MKLHVLGSSSAGNCYILESEAEALVIESGVRFLEVKQALNFDIAKISGVIITHEHNDHAQHTQQYIDAMCDVYATSGTIDALVSRSVVSGTRIPKAIKHGIVQQIGAYRVMPFNVNHDATEPVGFLIEHFECGIVMFVTDTHYIDYTFAGLNNIIIEANYCDDILRDNLESGRLPRARYSRTVCSHMSISTCVDALEANDLTRVNNIVLIHLSDSNSDADAFQKKAEDATGCAVRVADKGLVIEFNKEPF